MLWEDMSTRSMYRMVPDHASDLFIVRAQITYAVVNALMKPFQFWNVFFRLSWVELGELGGTGLCCVFETRKWIVNLESGMCDGWYR